MTTVDVTQAPTRRRRGFFNPKGLKPTYSRYSPRCAAFWQSRGMISEYRFG